MKTEKQILERINQLNKHELMAIKEGYKNVASDLSIRIIELKWVLDVV